MSKRDPGGAPNLLRRLVKGPNFGWNVFLAVLLVAEFLIFGMKNPRFLKVELLLRAANDYVIPIAFIAIFVTFVMITGGIDIQAGSIVGLTSIFIGIFWQKTPLGIWGAVIAAVLLAGLCGALSGFFIAYCRVQAMVVTLGGSFLYAGLALAAAKLCGISAYNGLTITEDSFKTFTKVRLFGAVPVPVFMLLVLLAVAYLLLHRSKYGRKIYLVGVNPSAADYSGVNSRAIILSTYVLTGLAAGVTGVFLTSYLSSAAKPDHGADLTMSIITACVLGGTLSTGGKGSVIGTALAAIAIGYMRYGLYLCFGVDKSYLNIPVGALLVVMVVARAVVSNPSVVALLSKLKPKPKEKTAA